MTNPKYNNTTTPNSSFVHLAVICKRNGCQKNKTACDGKQKTKTKNKKAVKAKGIEPPTFGTGIRRATIAPTSLLQRLRSN